MKKILAGFLTVTSAIIANASVANNKNYFNALGEMYKAGGAPSLTEIVNIAWAGRCFKSQDGNIPRNGGYIFRNTKGQILDSKYQAMNYDIALKSADFFDDKIFKQISSVDFWNGLDLGKTLTQSELEQKFFDIDMANGAITGKYNNNNITTSLKQSDKYLVEEISTESSGVVERCYYFKSI